MSNAYFTSMLSDYRQVQLAFDSFFDEYNDRISDPRRLRAVARRTLAARIFRHGIGLIRRGQIKPGAQLIRCAMDMDHRLRYFLPLWQILKVPGAAGQDWARLVLAEATARFRKPKGSAF